MNKQLTTLAFAAFVIIVIVAILFTFYAKKISALIAAQQGKTPAPDQYAQPTQYSQPGPYAGEYVFEKPATQKTKKEIEQLADQLADSLTSSVFGTGKATELLTQAADLSDDQLRTLVTYYNKIYSTSFYESVDNMFMPHTTIDDKLLGRLSLLGLKK